jgi:hypothetical protein
MKNYRSAKYIAGLLLGFVLVVCPSSLRAQELQSTCIECHSLLEDELKAPADSFANDVHNRPGLGCAGCHGGDNASDDIAVAMSPDNGFIGAPGALDVPKLCSRCHSDPVFMKTFNPRLPTDQYSKYLTSIHGLRNEGGDKKVAECASCHGAHGIQSVKNPGSRVYDVNIPATCAKCHADSGYMAEYGIPTDQYADYKKSVHGVDLLQNNDLVAPACNDCHGNHGAIPPQAESIDKVCGICHSYNMEDLENSTHAEYFEALGEPGCETCHSNHLILKPTVKMLIGDSVVCAQCHFEGDGTGALEAAARMGHAIDSLDNQISVAKAKLDDADNKGLFVNNGLFVLKDARQKFYKSRTEVHTFKVDSVEQIVDSGLILAMQADTIGDNLLRNYVFRRQGLFIAVVVLCFLALIIYLRVRRMEKGRNGRH